MDRMAEVLEEIMRAARHHLAKPDDQANKDRLVAAVEEAERTLYTQPDDLTFDDIKGPPWQLGEGWDPSWTGTRCPSCGHLHPITAETVNALSRTCLACGAPMRVYAMEGDTISLTPEAMTAFISDLKAPPPLADALRRAFEQWALLFRLAEGEAEFEAGEVQPANEVFNKIRQRTPEERAELDAAIKKVVESFPPRAVHDDFDALMNALLEKWKK